MNVRSATSDELLTLKPMYEDLLVSTGEPVHLWETWDDNAAAVERRLAAGDVLFAEQDGAVVGFADIELHTARVGWIDSLYVRPEARRRGVARALVAEAARILRERGATHIGLEVGARNDAARSLYDGLGFELEWRGLAVDVETLTSRLERRGAGASFGSVHVQTDDADAVERAVAQFLPRMGQTAGTIVTPPRDGWVAVYSELTDREPKHLRRLARELSDRIGAVVLAIGVEEGSVVRFALLERGRVMDEYLSVQEYYGPLPPGEVVALAANPRVVARLTGADAERVRAAALHGRSPAELPPAPELLASLAHAIGIPGGEVGYAHVAGTH